MSSHDVPGRQKLSVGEQNDLKACETKKTTSCRDLATLANLLSDAMSAANLLAT